MGSRGGVVKNLVGMEKVSTFAVGFLSGRGSSAG